MPGPRPVRYPGRGCEVAMSEPVLRVALDTVDVTIVTVTRLNRLGRRAAGAARGAAAPPARIALQVAGRAPRVRGRDGVRALVRDVVRTWLDVLVPVVVTAVLDRIDLTELVVRRLDLDRVAREIDIEAILDRLDLTDLAVRRLDLDRV